MHACVIEERVGENKTTLRAILWITVWFNMLKQ